MSILTEENIAQEATKVTLMQRGLFMGSRKERLNRPIAIKFALFINRKPLTLDTGVMINETQISIYIY